MNMYNFALAVAFLFLLGVGLGYWGDSKYQIRNRHLAAIIVVGALLLILGIPFMASICLVDGCSLGATIMTLTPIVLGLELIIIGISIPVIRKI